MDFYKELRALREKRGISRHEMAAMLGRNYVSMTRYETGAQLPPFDVAQSWAGLLGKELVIEMVDKDYKKDDSAV